MSLPRYAVYYAPEKDSMLDRLGIHWLGRTPEDPVKEKADAPEGLVEDEYRQLTAAPRHYGFHGTLKAPFALHETTTEKALRDAMRTMARTISPFESAGVRVSIVNRFLALVPVTIDPRLNRLHASCLRELEPHRAPLSEYDYARHAAKGLSERQNRLLRRFGYPFVLEEFRFHMTLTGNIEENKRLVCKEWLEVFAQQYLKEPFAVREICLFMQADRSKPFSLVERFKLKGRC